MKNFILMAVAGMLALSSCSNDDNEQTPQNTPRQMTFTAGFGDDAQMRASLDPSTKKVSFDAGDAISILSENNDNVKFTTTTGSEGGGGALFTGSAADDATYYAIYPYQDGLILALGTTIVGLEIPSNQSAAASSTCGWDPAAPLAYATTTGTSFTFHNLCALLKVTNDKADAVGIFIQDLDDTAGMTGSFNCDISTGTLTGGNPGVGVQGVPAGETVYIAIAPCTVGNLMAVWYDDDYNDRCKTKASVTFEAGKIYNLGNTNSWTDPVPAPAP